jgi:hypothetical protein
MKLTIFSATILSPAALGPNERPREREKMGPRDRGECSYQLHKLDLAQYHVGCHSPLVNVF